MSEQPKNVISIDGKDYDLDKLPLELRNTIAQDKKFNSLKCDMKLNWKKLMY